MNPYTALARKALRTYLESKKTVEPPQDLPKEMLEEKAGVFVTLEKDEELRGCIGTFLPAYNNIAEEVIKNAIAAGTRDNRFLPVIVSEIPKLSFTVSILSKPEQVEGLEDLDPKKYGVIVKGESTNRRGLLLPDLSGVDTPDKQVAICLQKGGINSEEEKVSFYRFTVKKYRG